MAYQGKRTPQKPPIEQQVVEGAFKVIWWLISYPFRRGKPQPKVGLDTGQRQVIAAHWRRVEELAANHSTYAQAVAEADKLLDLAFQQYGFPGATMGERLKGARDHFAPDLYQRLWDAHKLRNALAHEVGATVSEEQVRGALATFRQALDNL